MGAFGHGHGHGHGHHDHTVVDAAADTSAGRRALYLSLLVLLVTAAVQAAVVALSGSVALLGDTLHNLADALTAVPLLIAFRLGLRAANDRFTYGYGRAEDIAGLVVVGVITLSSVAAAYEAVRRLVHPQDVVHLWAVAAAAVVGFAGNEWVAAYRIRVGRRIGSAALVADGLHARADGLTSLAVLLGVAGSALGWGLADPVVGLLITVAILAILRSAIGHVGGRLMDAVDPALVASARHALHHVEGVRHVDRLRLRWVGHALYAEAEVVADPGSSLVEADRLADRAGDALSAEMPRLASSSVRVRAATPGT